VILLLLVMSVKMAPYWGKGGISWLSYLLNEFGHPDFFVWFYFKYIINSMPGKFPHILFREINYQLKISIGYLSFCIGHPLQNFRLYNWGWANLANVLPKLYGHFCRPQACDPPSLDTYLVKYALASELWVLKYTLCK
jgi:hypothetical protein